MSVSQTASHLAEATDISSSSCSVMAHQASRGLHAYGSCRGSCSRNSTRRFDTPPRAGIGRIWFRGGFAGRFGQQWREQYERRREPNRSRQRTGRFDERRIERCRFSDGWSGGWEQVTERQRWRLARVHLLRQARTPSRLGWTGSYWVLNLLTGATPVEGSRHVEGQGTSTPAVVVQPVIVPRSTDTLSFTRPRLGNVLTTTAWR